MEKIIGSEVKYFMVQESTENDGEMFIVYNEYNGSFSTSPIAVEATKFNLKVQAVDLAKLQNQMSQLLKQKFQYKVIEEVISRSELSLDEVTE